MKKDLIITALLFCLLIQFGVSIKNSLQFSKLEKQLFETRKEVSFLNEKLSIAESNIDSLNEEITNSWSEIDKLKEVERLKKDLDRSNQ